MYAIYLGLEIYHTGIVLEQAPSSRSVLTPASMAAVSTALTRRERLSAAPETFTHSRADAPSTVPVVEAAKLPKRTSSVFWIKLNFTVKTARLQSRKLQKYQHLQEEALLKARGLLKNWEDGPVLLIEDLYRQAAGRAGADADDDDDANELRNYTPEALALRFSLRNDPSILDAVKELWLIDTGPRDALGCINQRAYTALFRRIAKSVDARAFRAHQKRHVRTEKTIFEDWTRDSKGETEMSFANFFDSVFELADLWCETINVDEYVAFLERVWSRISEKRPRTRGEGGARQRVLRPLKRVMALDAESSDESSTSEEEDESEEDESEESEESSEEELDEDAEPPFPHSSLTHRFNTEKHIVETGVAALAPTSRDPGVALSDKIASAAGALGSLRARPASSPGSAAIDSDKPSSNRLLLSAAYQQQRIQMQLEKKRLSAVGTLRFRADSTGGGDRGSIGQIALGSSGSDLSALVEGTAFQSGNATKGGSGDSRKSLQLKVMYSSNESSGGGGSTVLTSSIAKPAPPLSSDLLLKTSGDPGGGDIGGSKAIDLLHPLRVPTVAVHVIESGIDGIINSSAGAGLAGRKELLTSATRNAIMNMTRSIQPAKASRTGFRGVVLSAMQTSQDDVETASTLPTRLDGLASASQVDSLGPEPSLYATEGTINRKGDASRSSALSTPVAQIDVRTKRQALSSAAAVAIERQHRPLATEATGETSERYFQGIARYAASSTVSSLSRLPSRANARAVRAQASRDRTRVLPSMSPMQRSLYRLDRDADLDGAGDSSFNDTGSSQVEPVDLTTSYSASSYVSDASKHALSDNSVHHQVSVRRAASDASASLDSQSTRADDATPLWFGLDTSAKRSDRKALRRVGRVPASRLQRVELETPYRDESSERRYDQRGHSALSRSTCKDDLLDASPWDTTGDDADDDEDGLLSRGPWSPSFTLPDGTESTRHSLSPLRSKARQRRRARENSSAASSRTRLSTASEASGWPILLVTTLASSSTHPSSPEFGQLAPALTTTSGLGYAVLESHASAPTLHSDHNFDRLDLAVLGSPGSDALVTQPHPSSPQRLQSSHHVQNWREEATALELEMRGERKPVTLSTSTVVHAHAAAESPSASRSPSRHRTTTVGTACSCSRSELRAECAYQHCDAARSCSQTAPDRLRRLTSPAFKMERQADASRNGSDGDRDDGMTRRRNEDAVGTNVTMVLNANRKIILQPWRVEDEVADEARKHQPTRSEMMKRRLKYTFGKP